MEKDGDFFKALSVRAGILAAVVMLFSGGEMMAKQSGLSIIPAPSDAKILEGSFILDDRTVILAKNLPGEAIDLGKYLAEKIKEACGVEAGLNPKKMPTPGRKITLSLNPGARNLGDEGYKLSIKPNSIAISALKPAGLFYGAQSLIQLAQAGSRIPCAEITDKPLYAWRGMMLDCCRHFMTADFVKRYIDLLACHKMNVFHWHLTEDQGWRLEIKRYPKLTEVGAWRDESGKRYGGFYTQDEVRDIVAYAKSRYVTAVPEIEMPGHSVAALAAYPEYSCTGRPMSVETNWGVFRDVFCPGKEKTFEFLENILNEVCDLFPSHYIHIGGDEVPKENWRDCPDCRKRIREEALKDENELQGYFTKRIEQALQRKGRRIIGWDEILEGGVTQTAVVQSWRGMAGAVEGAKHGNRVIVSPWEYTYFLCPQVKEEVRANFKTLNSLERVYSFDPAPKELEAAERSAVMGGECCLWAEWTWQFEVDPQIFPRLCALSEVLWTPKAKQDFVDFSRRLEAHFPKLEASGVDYHRPENKIGRWKGDDISRTPLQLWWDVTPFIKEAGIYRFNLVQDAGGDNVTVRWAALYEDGREVARLNRLNRSQVDMFMKYPLRLGTVKPGATYTLRVSMSATRDAPESSGSVWLRYFHDGGEEI